ncbi:MAG: hypothetical protein Ctma_0182 [Catillopecten margaritatus gill symbiont]|uniref:Cytochrome c domain-containing protein n=1 Tax=Catillopecten margaritatus gill symbiont TaxID=3083288 RepID=A0AAU6PER5_9GAMM
MFLTGKKVAIVAMVIMSMNSIVQADGKALYNSLGCGSCHGANGKSAIPAYPSLVGKSATYLVKQLRDFQTGARKNATMNAMAPMAAGHEQAIADYLSTQ